MVNSVEFAQRLGEILKFYGITAAAFSDMVQVNRSTISHLLSGRNKPSLEFVLKVLNAFPEVELFWLLNGQGHFPTQTKIEDQRQNPVVEKEQNASKTLFDVPNPPSSSEITPADAQIHQALNDTEVEQIVIFYKNGSFKHYRP